MATAGQSSPDQRPSESPKEQFLRHYDREHAITMRVLRAYPTDKLDLKPHEVSKSALELTKVFLIERTMGTVAFNDGFAQGITGPSASPPDSWDELLAAIDNAHQKFAELVRGTPDEALSEEVKFFSGPGTLGDLSRIDLIWFFLFDEIHHRGQFSVYLRMAGGKVPSIYGPSADEPWR
jgi:uncharacterized damage-inducible protein DinB